MGERFSLKNMAVSLCMLPVMIFWAVSRGEVGMIDNADLVIHEAGHAFFMFFGHFLYVLGGTLMQLILPSLIAWYFFRSSYRTGVQVALLWLGQNLINISVYAADASQMRLKLLGGSRVKHDWNYLLGQLDIIEYSSEVGYVIFAFAILVFLLSLSLPVFIESGN